MQVFEYGVEVAGVRKRLHAARSFAKRSRRRIYLERVPTKAHEPGAIRVIGKSKGWFFERNKCIGYVPADIAKKLVLNEMEDKVTTRLQFVSINDKDSLEIRFDILGSKDYYEKYVHSSTE
jgi:hypothetical protein